MGNAVTIISWVYFIRNARPLAHQKDNLYRTPWRRCRMNVKDVMKKTALIGLGIACITREKAERLARDLEKRGELSAKDKKKMLDKVMKQSKTHTAKLEKLMRSEVGKALKATGKAAVKELKMIKKELRKR